MVRTAVDGGDRRGVILEKYKRAIMTKKTLQVAWTIIFAYCSIALLGLFFAQMYLFANMMLYGVNPFVTGGFSWIAALVIGTLGKKGIIVWYEVMLIILALAFVDKARVLGRRFSNG